MLRQQKTDITAAQNNLQRFLWLGKYMTAPNQILNSCRELIKASFRRCLSILLLWLPVCHRSAVPQTVCGPTTAARLLS